MNGLYKTYYVEEFTSNNIHFLKTNLTRSSFSHHSTTEGVKAKTCAQNSGFKYHHKKHE